MGVVFFLRLCATVVPDVELISEVMLVGEEFIDARLLARKFITSYALSRELLSKQVMVSLGFWVTYMLINTYLIPVQLDIV